MYSPLELHEYWGTVNGNWVTGPNVYYDQILYDSFNFLYNYLDIAIGDFNDDSNTNILDIIILVNHILNSNEVELDGADINGDGNIDILDVVQWLNIVLNQ